jgi:hypothetical protein
VSMRSIQLVSTTYNRTQGGLLMSQKKKQNRATRDRLERERILTSLKKPGILASLIAMFSNKKRRT